MREAFSKALVQAAKDNSKLYLLTGDHGYALFDGLRKSSPERFINAGVAEQNMVGVASGLSKMGFLPVIYGLSAFVPVRVLEQIKIDFCYENLPCILIGDGAGVVYSHLGTSHQSTEDIACLRAIPNIRILSPADKFELESCFQLALQAKAPVYLRFGKSDLGDVHKKAPDIAWGKPLEVKSGSGSTVFYATGSMVHQALRLANEKYPDASVYSVPCLKPLDENHFIQTFKGKKNVIVIEEHSVYGGLGSAVAEVVSSVGGPRVVRLGIKDRFSKMCGTYQYLMKEHELDFEALARDVAIQLERVL
ncbi:transketolase family protein [Bdellovibrio sp. HCB337]|uniref:transketolase family protein n=1 Tax=Bdellovibrio sp. HCB337 TaxID=3394358 RepID=UPI0039A48F34